MKSGVLANQRPLVGVILSTQPDKGQIRVVDTIARSEAIAVGEVVLVERARRGDHGAFTNLVDRRLGSTFRTAMVILGNEADARDATQEIFLRAWRNLPALRDADRFAPWFGRIVVNTCRTAIRGRRRRIVQEISIEALPGGGDQLPSTLSAHEERGADLELLGRAIGRLSIDERTLLALHHLEHLSLRDIGERIGVRDLTVKSRLFSARRSLERALEVERR